MVVKQLVQTTQWRLWIFIEAPFQWCYLQFGFTTRHFHEADGSLFATLQRRRCKEWFPLFVILFLKHPTHQFMLLIVLGSARSRNSRNSMTGMGAHIWEHQVICSKFANGQDTMPQILQSKPLQTMECKTQCKKSICTTNDISNTAKSFVPSVGQSWNYFLDIVFLLGVVSHGDGWWNLKRLYNDDFLSKYIRFWYVSWTYLEATCSIRLGSSYPSTYLPQDYDTPVVYRHHLSWDLETSNLSHRSHPTTIPPSRYTSSTVSPWYQGWIIPLDQRNSMSPTWELWKNIGFPDWFCRFYNDLTLSNFLWRQLLGRVRPLADHGRVTTVTVTLRTLNHVSFIFF